MGMKRGALLALVSGASAAIVAPVHAQVSELRVREAIDDAARGLGRAISAGSPLTGPAGTTGGLGRIRVGAAVTATDIEIDDPQRASGTIGFVLPVATITGAVGILGGSGSGFGAVDIIGRAGPVLARQQIAESPFLVSLGARIGILREGALFPDASVSVFRSRVNDLAYGEEDDEVSFNGEVRTVSLRVDVSKRFLLVAPYAGAGLDRTEIEAVYRIPEEQSTGGDEIQGRIEASGTHPRAYAGVELALALLAVSVEVGTAGGERFGALGARLGF